MVVINYKQDKTEKKKKVIRIVEVDLTMSKEVLFGKITREQIEKLDTVVKSVPQKEKPTTEQYLKMYELRDKLHKNGGAIRLDIKCNSTQSRLQCSFNHFQTFIENNPSRVVAISEDNHFRGGIITMEIQSARRIFKKKPV